MDEINNEVTEQPAETPVEAPAPTMAEAISAALKPDEQEGQPAEPSTAEDSQGSARDEKGRFLKKEGEAEEVKIEPKPEAKQEAKADDMPEGLAPKAQERFREMSERTKALGEEVSTYKETLTSLTTALQEHGVTDETFRDLLTYAKAIHVNDVDAWGDMLANQIANYERATGRSFGNVDTLTIHPDLKQAVDAGQITREYAMQLVQSRDIQARVQTQNNQMQQTQQAQHAEQQAMDKGVSAVATLCQGYQANDLDWPTKKPMVEKYANQIAGTLPPAHWAEAIQAFYSNIHMPAPQQQQQHRPLRAQGGTTGIREPQSMVDAIRASMGR